MGTERTEDVKAAETVTPGFNQPTEVRGSQGCRRLQGHASVTGKNTH